MKSKKDACQLLKKTIKKNDELIEFGKKLAFFLKVLFTIFMLGVFCAYTIFKVSTSFLTIFVFLLIVLFAMLVMINSSIKNYINKNKNLDYRIYRLLRL